MAIPASDLTNTHTNATSDDPSQARAELNAAILKINAFIDAMGTGASEGLKLDSNGDIPVNINHAGNTSLADNIHSYWGNANDLDIYHSSINSYVENNVGGLIINNNVTSGDIFLQSADSGSTLNTCIRYGGLNSIVKLFAAGVLEAETLAGSFNVLNKLTAPTPAPATNTTEVATTAFVKSQAPAATIGSYTRASYYYTRNGVSSDFFDITTVTTENSWGTVGPTGSGSDDIFVELDALPTDTIFVRLAMDLGITATTAGVLRKPEIHMKPGGSLLGLSATTVVAKVQGKMHNSTDKLLVRVYVDVPVDSNKVFNVSYLLNSGAIFSSRCFLAGFGVEG